MPTTDKMELIAKLLRKAEHTTNEAERALYMERATELGTTYRVDLAAARAHTAVGEVREEPEVRRITLSRPRTLGASTYTDLFQAIGDPHDVRCTMTKDHTVIWAHGFPRDIDLVNALYVSLLLQMRTEADAYLASGAHQQETVWRDSTERYDWRTGVTTGRSAGFYPVSGRTARISFQEAFAVRVGTRIRAAKEAAMEALAQAEANAAADAYARLGEEAFATAPPASTSAELVLKGREVQAREHWNAETKGIKEWKGRDRNHSRHALRAGRAAGDRARLGSEKAIGGSRAAVTA